MQMARDITEHPVILNLEGRFPGLIVVDHAGTSSPPRFGALGLADLWCETHHFCDLGVTPLAHALAHRLDVPVILGTVSRLVIDVNRWLDDPRLILRHVEGQSIPGNASPDAAERKMRQDHIFWPYHTAIAALWRRITQRHRDPLFLALHSCTRTFGNARRPWDCGTIWNESPRLAHPLLDALGSACDLTLGDNEPYTGRDGVYTLDRHTWDSGYRSCGLEVSNDLLRTGAELARWVDLLSHALAAVSQSEVPR